MLQWLFCVRASNSDLLFECWGNSADFGVSVQSVHIGCVHVFHCTRCLNNKTLHISS